VEELNETTTLLIQVIHSKKFVAEKSNLQKKQEVHNGSKLVALTPFLDSKGIICISGKLYHADIEFSQRYPIILPTKHPFTELII